MKYKGYLIDLDGTMYNGTAVIDGAVDFIDRLNEAGIPYVFLTNNATKTQAEAAQKLIDMGFHIHPETLYTSAMATAAYLKETDPGATVYAIGSDSLKETLKDAGITLTEADAEYVVMGLDTEINYEKLSKAALMINNGSKFISTNPDRKFPTEQGLVPGNGALVAVLASATDVEPVVIGKPQGIILESAVASLDLPKEAVLMVGDNYDTDILTGINGGVDTLHVNTGVTSNEEMNSKTHRPTYMINNLKEWSVD
ncbi:TIGR01457 family HAD-type hydrolase [Salinicoccus sp. HZC-1]|uniref:TIGR01457 family HAD-type hydrolase n=1 Tax=Salinicoccus sp. HZC-1 TaxID=3385497 RepID=UPI00398AE20D